MIKMSIKNTGKPVEAVTLRVADENIENEILLKNSKLGPGDLLVREIPIVKTGKTIISLFPHVKYKDEVVPCEEPVLEINNLPNC
jgi:hypothetical protein